MHIQVGMGPGLELRAERHQKRFVEWEIRAYQKDPVQGGLDGVWCGSVTCFEGKARSRTAEHEGVCKLLRKEIHLDMYASSMKRVMRLVCEFCAVEYIHEL